MRMVAIVMAAAALAGCAERAPPRVEPAPSAPPDFEAALRAPPNRQAQAALAARRKQERDRLSAAWVACARKAICQLDDGRSDAAFVTKIVMHECRAEVAAIAEDIGLSRYDPFVEKTWTKVTGEAILSTRRARRDGREVCMSPPLPGPPAVPRPRPPITTF